MNTAKASYATFSAKDVIFSVKCLNENINTGVAGVGVIVALLATTGDL